MPFNVLGISGSPVKKGNVDTFLEAMMEMTRERGHTAESVHLSRLDIQDCVHCNFCIRKQKPGHYCSLKDDAQQVFEKLEAADIIVLASPVYFMRTSGRMASFIDRLRVFIFGNEAKGRLHNKIGVSAAVAWARHGGMETTHLSHLYAFFTLEMIPATVHASVSPLGAAGMASQHGMGAFDPDIRLGAEQDKAGLAGAKAHIDRAVELAALVNKEEGT